MARSRARFIAVAATTPSSSTTQLLSTGGGLTSCTRSSRRSRHFDFSTASQSDANSAIDMQLGTGATRLDFDTHGTHKQDNKIDAFVGGSGTAGSTPTPSLFSPSPSFEGFEEFLRSPTEATPRRQKRFLAQTPSAAAAAQAPQHAAALTPRARRSPRSASSLSAEQSNQAFAPPHPPRTTDASPSMSTRVAQSYHHSMMSIKVRTHPRRRAHQNRRWHRISHAHAAEHRCRRHHAQRHDGRRQGHGTIFLRLVPENSRHLHRCTHHLNMLFRCPHHSLDDSLRRVCASVQRCITFLMQHARYHRLCLLRLQLRPHLFPLLLHLPVTPHA